MAHVNGQPLVSIPTKTIAVAGLVGGSIPSPATIGKLKPCNGSADAGLFVSGPAIFRCLAVVRLPTTSRGIGTTYSLAYQDAVASATAICSDSGGTITHVDELNAEQISSNVWLINITALCET
jgi:hypothetical protein